MADGVPAVPFAVLVATVDCLVRRVGGGGRQSVHDGVHAGFGAERVVGWSAHGVRSGAVIRSGVGGRRNEVLVKGQVLMSYTGNMFLDEAPVFEVVLRS